MQVSAGASVVCLSDCASAYICHPTPSVGAGALMRVVAAQGGVTYLDISNNNIGRGVCGFTCAHFYIARIPECINDIIPLFIIGM